MALKPTYNQRVDEIKPGQFIEVGEHMYTVLNTQSGFDGMTRIRLSTSNFTCIYINITFPSDLKITVHTES